MSTTDERRNKALDSYKKSLMQHKEHESKLKALREQYKKLQKDHNQSEDNLKALQSVGQIIGEILKDLGDEKFIVKATNGPRYVVGCRRTVDKDKLKQGTRVALDMTTLTIMRCLPREVDPLVYNMSHEDPGDVKYGEIGGLSEQIRELREVIELPLINPELFHRVGISPPKGCLLYGPPGTGKTLLARAVASQLDCNFLKVVSSAIVDKYIGESARLIREMFKGCGFFNGPKRSFIFTLYSTLNEQNPQLFSPPTPATTSPALSSWTKSTPLEVKDSQRVLPPTEKSKEHSWSCSIKWTVSTPSAKSK